MPDPHRIEKHKKLAIVRNIGWQNRSPWPIRCQRTPPLIPVLRVKSGWLLENLVAR